MKNSRIIVSENFVAGSIDVESRESVDVDQVGQWSKEQGIRGAISNLEQVVNNTSRDVPTDMTVEDQCTERQISGIETTEGGRYCWSDQQVSRCG